MLGGEVEAGYNPAALKKTVFLTEDSARARGESDERYRGGGRTVCGTGVEPGGAGGGYVCRSDEDVYGHTAEHELVAAVFATGAGDAGDDRGGGEAGWVGTGGGEPAPPESEARGGDGEPHAGAKSQPNAGY